MALLTALPLEEARALGALYGLDVTTVRPIQAGSVNSNFEVDGPSGRRFLRIYEEQTGATAAREAALLAHLSRSGVPTPEPLARRDGEGFISTFAAKPVAVFPFCEGEMICQRGVTPAKARAVGEALGRIHRAGEDLGPSEVAALAGATRFGPEALLARLERVLASGPPADVVVAASELTAFLAEPRPEPRTKGLIHGDIFRDNVLWRGDSITAVLDFESASMGSLAFDVMVTILAWSFGDDLDTTLASALYAGYAAAGPRGALPADELFDAGRLACARFATTRITDFELRPRGTVVYKDFRRWRARHARLDALGPSGLRGALGA
jgi:homoserine kinase type II